MMIEHLAWKRALDEPTSEARAKHFLGDLTHYFDRRSEYESDIREVAAMFAEIARLQARVAELQSNGAPCTACGHIIDWKGYCACDQEYLGVNCQRREQLLRECGEFLDDGMEPQDWVWHTQLRARIRAELGESACT